MSTTRLVKVKLDPGAYMPQRAHSTDAGADLRCMYMFTVEPHSSTLIDTGVHIELPRGTAGLLVSKSGLNTKHKIQTTGLIDEGFTGSIMIRVYNDSSVPYTFNKGDKVSQLVIMPVYYPGFISVDEIDGGERGSHGYGSTGK